MRRRSLAAMSLVVLCQVGAFAQDRGIEVQGGAGYVFDSGEGPSVPAVNAGLVSWFTRGWGLGARLTEGLTDDRDIRDLRIWALTSQWRWFGRDTDASSGSTCVARRSATPYR